KNSPGRCHLFVILLILPLLIFPGKAAAMPLSDASSPIPAAAMKLVQFCTDPQGQFDSQAATTLVDYVLAAKTERESDLPKLKDAPGAYYEFDTRINFAGFLQYSYGKQIPSSLTSPASLRYSLWSGISGEEQKLTGNWIPLPADGKPLIICGLQRDGITPDLHTGIYYEYNLKKTYILLNHKGRQVLISISKQIDISDIGKKGVILGSDDDWNYYYSDIPGSTKTGLGWIKSYIYDYFSVGVHAESVSAPATVRSGIFQWIRAGWSGINFVQTSHIINGIKRNARNTKLILESPHLPAAKQLAATYRQLAALPHNDLIDRYTALQQARQSLAVASGKFATKEIKQQTYAHIPKEQILEELMLEYFKNRMGKHSLLGEKAGCGIN
ncbi:MAG TPA: hypothetical protein PK114_04655, partial [Smithellaceae bacterium]|nr:hypothetical protein [Smithellaceae bacterium]